LSIGSKFKVNNNGVLTIGKGATTESGTKYWTISANDEDSYIAYGGNSFQKATRDDEIQEDEYIDDNIHNYNSTKVYLGTDGISLGTKFSITNKGELTAYSGKIGGWEIKDNVLSADGIEINSNGAIQANYSEGKT
jgi:hypothetical protein